MRASWRLKTETQKEVNAERVLERVLQAMQQKGLNQTIQVDSLTSTCLLTFQTDLKSPTWEGSVVEVIALAQLIGYEWMLFGDVHRELLGTSQRTRVAGITWAEWVLSRMEI